MAHVEGRVLVATADLPHLTPEAVRFLLERAPEAALVYPIVPKERVEARFPGNRRTYARLREGTFTGGNLLLLDKALFFQALPLARRAVALRKNPLALARMVGLDILLKLLLGRLSLLEVEARAKRILGVEARAGAPEILDLLARIDDPAARAAIAAERAFMRVLEGGCAVAIGAYARLVDGRLCLLGAVAAPDGSRVFRDEVAGDPARAEALGEELARRLLARGAGEVLTGARA